MGEKQTENREMSNMQLINVRVSIEGSRKTKSYGRELTVEWSVKNYKWRSFGKDTTNQGMRMPFLNKNRIPIKYYKKCYCSN